MLQNGINLVLKLFPVYGTAAAAGTSGVTGLEHEVGNYAVEDNVVVVAALGERGEVLAGLGGRQAAGFGGAGIRE
jgi:hypothetical protein